jgi:acyl dehydratase
MTSLRQATKRACNEVDQNLFHVDPPAARLASVYPAMI